MEEKNILFHGSNVIVEHPEIRVYGHFKDFGYGFYCTRYEQQAKKWALTKNTEHIVTRYCTQAALKCIIYKDYFAI